MGKKIFVKALRDIWVWARTCRWHSLSDQQCRHCLATTPKTCHHQRHYCYNLSHENSYISILESCTYLAQSRRPTRRLRCCKALFRVTLYPTDRMFTTTRRASYPTQPTRTTLGGEHRRIETHCVWLSRFCAGDNAGGDLTAQVSHQAVTENFEYTSCLFSGNALAPSYRNPS